MPILKDMVTILRVQEQSNTSQICVVLGRRLGQLHVMAKGARRWQKRGFEGGMEPLCEGEMLVYPRPGDRLWILREWDERARLAPSRTAPTPADLKSGRAMQPWERLTAAAFASDLGRAFTVESLNEDHSASNRHMLADEDALTAAPFAEPIEALREARIHLEQGMEPCAWAWRLALRLIQYAGWLPDLTQCGECGGPLAGQGPAFWGVDGIQCGKCAKQAEPPAASARGYERTAVQAPLRAALEPADLATLGFYLRTGKEVQLAPAARKRLAQALVMVVRNTLEHDLRTLRGMARLMLDAHSAAGKTP